MNQSSASDEQRRDRGGAGVFAVRDAIGSGLSPARLRTRRYRAPFHGVRALAEHPSIRELDHLADAGPHDASAGAERDWSAERRGVLARAILFAPKLPASAAYSHVSAAQLHGFALPSRLRDDTRLHIATPFHEERPRIRGVVAHVTPTHRLHVTIVDGIRCATPVDTWLQLTSMLSVEQLVVIGDQLVRRENPLATLHELQHAVESSAGRHGIVRARAAIISIRPGTDSPKETETRLAITDAGLPEPRVNRVIRDRNGVYLRRGDLVFPRWKVLVEFDGDGHRVDRAQFRLDIDVHAALRDEGWETVRIHGGHTRADVGRLVERALRRQGWTR